MMMNTMKMKRIAAILAILCLSLMYFAAPDHAQAQSGKPYEILAEINALRAANGLPALSENTYLNLAAQNHADWIAEDPANRGGHEGPGGNSAYDRALAVGYGEGKQIWVTENWARGRGLTPSECVYVSWNDAAHMGNMLTTWHNEFGAGVALDTQGMTVYVVDFGHSSGSLPIQPTVTPGGPTSTSAPLIYPVTTTTPNPDGSVTHIVKYGQTLYGIAEAYGITLADLLALNGLTEDSAIYPDDELIIVPVNEGAQETPETTGTPQVEEARPSSTLTPTETVKVTSTQPMMTATPIEKNNPVSRFLTNIFSGDTLWVGIGLVAVSVFGIVLLFFTTARLR